jgi:hypothetical protein
MSGLREYLSGLNDGPGGTSGGLMPCSRCGGPKPPGRGRRLCDTCPPADSPKPCHCCGERKTRSISSRYCDDCRAIAKEVTVKRRRNRERRTVKVCRGGCGRSGPFRLPTGAITPYCTRCRAAKFAVTLCSACKTRPIRAKKTRLCTSCKRAADETKALKKREWEAANPERVHDTQRRARDRRREHYRKEQRDRQRIHRALKREAKGGSLAPHESARGRQDQFPMLPAAPLAAAIERLIVAEAAGAYPMAPAIHIRSDTGNTIAMGKGGSHEEGSSPREIVCARLGVETRSLFGWRSGERKTVQFDTADRILTLAGWCWWDIWTAEEAQFAFEGPVAA